MARRVVVYHATYGCDTGCCGHVVRVTDGDKHDEDFHFMHPGRYDVQKREWLPESDQEFAKRVVIAAFGSDHCADIDFEKCVISDD